MKIKTFEEMTDFLSLRAAALRAVRGERHKPSVATFLMDLEPELFALERELRDGSWRPRPLRRFAIRDPKPRVIASSHLRDRVVHHALCAALEPMFESYAIFDSYACRPGKGGHAAICRARDFAGRSDWFVKLDVRHYFETVDHGVLLRCLERRGLRDRTLELARVIIEAGGQEGRGLPIGSLTSQHFGNLLLGRLDHHMKDDLGLRCYLRYMDDILIFAPDRERALVFRAEAERFIREDLRLELKEEALRQGPIYDGVPFLGFRIWPSLIRFDGARKRRWYARMSAVDRAVVRGAISQERGARFMEGLLAWASVGDTWNLRMAWHHRHLDAL